MAAVHLRYFSTLEIQQSVEVGTPTRESHDAWMDRARAEVNRDDFVIDDSAVLLTFDP